MDRDEQLRKNLELARRHLKQMLANPSAMADIPNGAHVVFIPSDDPELAEANIQMARGLQAGPPGPRRRRLTKTTGSRAKTLARARIVRGSAAALSARADEPVRLTLA